MTQVSLSRVVGAFDDFFQLKELDQDPAMSNFVPMVYKKSLRWKKLFEPDFLNRFNGLMIKGATGVNKIFTASFPSDEILEQFISQSTEGDLLFIHHPIILECGNPEGNLGRGLLPLNFKLVDKIVDKNLSIYSCHAPLDYHSKISTGRAIAAGLDSTIESEFLPYGNGNAGLVVKIKPVSTDTLIAKSIEIFNILKVDFAGEKFDQISRIAIVPGGGDDIEYMQTSQKLGAQAYLTGEIYSHYDNDWGKQNTAKIEQYVKNANLSFIGVSHAASEFLVMKTLIPKWIQENFSLLVFPLSQTEWWV